MFPKYSEIVGPLVAELKRRGGKSKPSDRNHSGKTVYESLADHFGLSKEARDHKIYEASGAERSKWHNMVRWARNDLVKWGLLSSPEYGVWALTDKGVLRASNFLEEKAGRGTAQSGIEISLERFKELLKEAARIGELGEDIVIKYEKKRLFDAGKHQLSEAVRQISIENVAAGYDILSFETNGSDRFIEVKASKNTCHNFELSRNEYETSKKFRSQYWIYLVSNIEKEPQVIQLQDPSSLKEQGKLIFKPSSYTVTLTEE